jgi:RNA polymerase sigma factor (sigma-70 family)
MNLSEKAAVERLIKECTSGDRKSQQFLYKNFSGKMLVVCYRYAGNKDEAQEMLHEGFIKVFKNLANFKNEGSLEGWIRRIMVNNAIDHIRRKHDYFMSDGEKQIEKLSNTLVEEDNEEQFIKAKAEILLHLIQKLSPAYRTVFNLYVIEEYSHKEIAEELGIHIGTSKSNLAKAKLKLQELYHAYERERENKQ